MKKDIHPKYNEAVKAQCGCGAIFTVGSTSDKVEIEVCSQCHPFYTGKEKLIDATGRVDRFKKMVAKKQELVKGGKKAKKQARAEKKTKAKS